MSLKKVCQEKEVMIILMAIIFSQIAILERIQTSLENLQACLNRIDQTSPF